MPKYEADIEHLITDEEIFLMFKTCRDLRERAMLSILYLTGARPSEIIRNKERSDLELTREKIEVTPGKITIQLPVLKRKGRGKFALRLRNLVYPRPIPPNKYIEAIVRYVDLEAIPKQPLFPFCDERVRQIVRRISTEALGFRLCPYNFRHTRLTKFYKTHSDKDTMMFKGSDDPRTLKPYVHIKEVNIDMDDI